MKKKFDIDHWLQKAEIDNRTQPPPIQLKITTWTMVQERDFGIY